TSDSLENAAVELKRFFKDDEIFDYTLPTHQFLYAADEV
ncbi:MAG: nucleoside-diphosphate kinase, partial [Sodaliphilus sp.]|nr:nucleoside-diphosphate kinase [Sodaliphilus sp.]